jgi:hypothetical protein
MRRDEITCTECERRFWSEFTFGRHTKGGRCRSEAALRAIGLHLNAAGVWTRVDSPARRQLRLFRLRAGRPRMAEKNCGGRPSGPVRRSSGPSGQERLPGIPGAAQRLEPRAA